MKLSTEERKQVAQAEKVMGAISTKLAEAKASKSNITEGKADLTKLAVELGERRESLKNSAGN